MSTDLYPKLMNYLTEPDFFSRADLHKALRVAVKQHEPGHRHAGVSERFGNAADKCAYCHLGEPVAEFMGDVNGTWMKTHCHGYTTWCADCQSEPDDDGYLTYPCSALKAICEALGVTW